MATPVTIKQMELAKKRAEEKKKNNAANTQRQLSLTEQLKWQQAGYRGGNMHGYNHGYGGGAAYGHNHGNNIDFTKDYAEGRQYTSFEKNTKKTTTTDTSNDKNLLLVKDAPAQLAVDEFLIDDNNVVCFNGRQHWLSNFYPAAMTIDGHEYPTVEHYYQACKLYTLGDSRLAMQIRRIPDAGNVKVAAKRLLRGVVSFDQIDRWKYSKGAAILKHAITHKFVQNPDLREKLLATGDNILAHTYDKDRVFATGCTKEKLIEWAKQRAGQTLKIPKEVTSETLVYVPMVGEGKNLLGVINMKVREQVRNFQTTSRDNADPILAAAIATLRLDSSTSDGVAKRKDESDGAVRNKDVSA